MNLRDLSHKLIKQFAADGEREYEEWLNVTDGRRFGTNEPIDQHKIFQYAFSKGVSTILRRIDEIKVKKEG